MARIPVNFNNSPCQKTIYLKYDVLVRQQLPIGSVCLSEPSTLKNQENYSGYPLTCLSVKKDFADFKSLEEFQAKEGLFPFEVSPELRNESSTQYAFMVNVLRPILECLNNCFYIKLQESLSGNGRPDITLSIPLNNFEKPFLIIEVKPCNAFCNNNVETLETLIKLNGSQALEQDVKFSERDTSNPRILESEHRKPGETDGQLNLRRGLKQLKYYLCHVKTEEAFGILTSYCHTYFVILQQNEFKQRQLIISPVVRFCDKDVLEKISQFIHKAFRSESKVILETPVIILLSPWKTRAGVYGKEEREAKRHKSGKENGADINQHEETVGDSSNEQQCSGSQYIQRGVIGEGRSGVVFKIFDHENQKTFAAKSIVDRCCEDIIHELQNEHEIYIKMKCLQGKVVPHFHFFGYLDGWRPTLVMDLLNAEPIHKVDNLSEEEKALIVTALEEIHNIGILHGDIRVQNILLDRKTVNAYFIDFAFSRKCDCKDAFEKEKEELRNLLNML